MSDNNDYVNHAAQPRCHKEFEPGFAPADNDDGRGYILDGTEPGPGQSDPRPGRLETMGGGPRGRSGAQDSMGDVTPLTPHENKKALEGPISKEVIMTVKDELKRLLPVLVEAKGASIERQNAILHVKKAIGSLEAGGDVEVPSAEALVGDAPVDKPGKGKKGS